MARAFLCLVALGISSVAWGAQPPARDTSVAAGTGSIRGQVVDATGHPLSRVEVRAGPTPAEGRVATTDADGRYELAHLPAGTYTIVATKPNYVRTAWGEPRPEGPGKRIPLGDGQRLENIDVRLLRTAAVTGKIVDEFGDPITDVMVTPMRYQYVQGTRRLMPSGRGGMTNDLGEYRVYGLTPGQYYLSATLRSLSGPLVVDSSSDRSGYAPTYFPGTGSIAEAQRLTMTAGQTATAVNFSLLPIQTAKISGSAFDGDGKPLVTGMVMITPKTAGLGIGTMGIPLNAEGQFTISGVAPGDYVLRANAGGSQDSATADVTVTGGDVTGVQLNVTKPSAIRGRIAFTASATGANPPKPTAYDLGAVREWALGQPVRSQARISDDGTFEITLPAGHVQLRAAPVGGATGPAAQNGPPPWRINRVIFADADVGDAGIDVPPNATIENVIVEMTNHSSDISGRVTDAEGHAVSDALVIVFAQDPSRWTVQTRWVSVARPALDDLFHARLLAGDYFAVAMSGVETNAWTDPDFLSLAREHATKFSVADGEKKTVDLPLTPAPVY